MLLKAMWLCVEFKTRGPKLNTVHKYVKVAHYTV